MKKKIPSGLKKSKRIWVTVRDGFDELPGDEFILELLCRTYDRWDESRCRLDTEGLTISQDGRTVLNPVAVIEKDCRLAFLRLWKALNLDIESPLSPGRQPEHSLVRRK